jgi:hypothetical protein
MVSSSGADMDDGLGSFETEASQEQIDLGAHNTNLALGTQRIILPEGATKADAIYVMSQSIPMNQFGMPEFFYRSDFLPYDLGRLSHNDADAAVVPLSYEEGFPTYGKGSIFWHQLPHEQFADFQLFMRFLEQAEELGIRQIAMLAATQQVKQERLYSLSLEYYWSMRARAYDLFAVAADKKKREVRSRKTETKHFDMAQSLMEQLLRKFEEPDWINQLGSKEALDVLTDLVKIQRLSLGLNSNGSVSAGQVADQGASAEMIMRQITAGFSDNADSMSLTPALQGLLADPKMGMQIQELVLKVRGHNQIAPTVNNPGFQ